MPFPLSTSFLDQLPMGFILVDTEGRIQWANLWVKERLSTPLSPGLPLETITNPEARQALQKGLENTFIHHLPTFLSYRMHQRIFQLAAPPGQHRLSGTPHQVYILYFGEPLGEPLAAIVVEDLTARWIAEDRLRQQLVRQRAQYNAISPLLSRPEPEALQHSLEALRPLYQPEHLALYLVEEGQQELRLSVALGSSKDLPQSPPENSLVRWAFKAKRRYVWRMNDPYLLSRDLHPLDPESRAAIAIPLGTARSLSSTLSKRNLDLAKESRSDTPLGILTLESRQVDAFDEDDLGLLQNVADHIAIHLQWQRSYERERRLRRLADILRETGLQLTTTLDSDRIQDLILRFVGEVVPYDSACILLLHADNRVTASRYRGYDRFGVSDAAMHSLELNLKEVANLKRMAQTHQPLVIPDTTKDSHWILLPTSKHVKSWVGAPIVTRERLIGFLALDHTEPGFYNAEHAQVLALFANQAALALENAWLYEKRYLESITDPLTGLANRRYFQSQLEREVARAKRFQRPLSLLMIDLDDFKRYNDTFGHPAGDEALKLVAQAMEQNTRSVDLTARYGGEEFVAILTETPSNKALKVAQRIVQAVRRLHQKPGTPLRASLTVSAGVATLPDHAESMEDLILAADVALYYAKRHGKDQVAVYSPDFSSSIPHHSAFD